MKQKLLALCITIVCAMTTHAQMAHYYLGTGRNEVARSVKVLYDGSSIIAGYIYDLDPQGNVQNADNLLVRVAPNGTIIWQKQWGTSNDDLLYEMIITRDTNIVVVGTAGRTGIYQDNTAAIYRFDINGVMLNENFVRDLNTTTGGELFNGIAETTKGDLVAVGAHDFTPATVDAFISVFRSDLTHLYSETIPLSNVQSDMFTNIVADDSNKVYIIGYMYRGAPATTTYYDQIVLEFNPYSAPIGVINWMNYYDISYTIGTDPNSVTLDCDWPVKVFLQKDKILVTAMDANGWGFAGGNRHYIFRCNKNSGSNPEVRIVNNGVPHAQYSNSSMIIPVTRDRMFITNVPGANAYDYDRTGVVSNMDVWASYVSSFSNKTVSASTRFSLNDNESVQSLDLNKTGGKLNGYLYMAGNAQPQGAMDNDIYFAIVNSGLHDSLGSATCPVADTTALDSIVTYPMFYWVPQDSVAIKEPLRTDTIMIAMSASIQCGDSLHNKQSPTGIATQIVKTATLKIAPNPASGQFNVFYAITQAFDKAELVITDITGKTIISNISIDDGSGIVQINIPGTVPAGILLCNFVIDGESIKQEKIVLVK